MRKGMLLVRNGKNECLISSSDFVHMLTGNRHGYGFYHLTRWSSLCRMMEPVVVPGDGGAHRMLHLGAAFNMNDENDKKCGKRVYFTSFSFGPPENISMWTNYGIPNEEAVRITIPSGVMSDWVEDFNAGRIEVYGVGSDGALKPLASEACLRMVDVAYWSKKEVGRNRRDPNEGLFFYDGDKFRLTDCSDVDKFMAQQPYLFKEFGWNYEKETRLVLEFASEDFLLPVALHQGTSLGSLAVGLELIQCVCHGLDDDEIDAGTYLVPFRIRHRSLDILTEFLLELRSEAEARDIGNEGQRILHASYNDLIVEISDVKIHSLSFFF